LVGSGEEPPEALGLPQAQGVPPRNKKKKLNKSKKKEFKILSLNFFYFVVLAPIYIFSIWLL